MKVIFGYLIGIFMFVAWPYGAWHAFSEHDTGHVVAIIIIPPYAWYFAAESFWHNQGATTKRVGNTLKADSKEDAEKYLVAKCQNDEEGFHGSGIDRKKYNEYCSCYWENMISSYPEGEADYFDRHGRNSPEFENMAKSLIMKCVEAAKR